MLRKVQGEGEGEITVLGVSDRHLLDGESHLGTHIMVFSGSMWALAHVGPSAFGQR